MYGDDEKVIIMTQEYVGSSDEELLLTIKGLWEVIDEYDLLPIETDEDGEETAPGRSRRVSQAIIGFELPEVTGNANVRAAELRQRANKRLANRRVAFRMVKNSLTNEKALKYFNAALEEGTGQMGLLFGTVGVTVA